MLSANASPGPDKIVFASGVKAIDPQLAPVSTGSGLGPLVVSDDLHIEGPGSAKLTIDGLQSWIDASGNLNVGLPCGQNGTQITALSGVLFEVSKPGVSLKVEGMTVTRTGGLLTAGGDRAGGIISFRDLRVIDNAPIASPGGPLNCNTPLVDMGWGGQFVVADSSFGGNAIGFNTVADTGMIFSRSRTTIDGTSFDSNTCYMAPGGQSCPASFFGGAGTWDLRVFRGPAGRPYGPATADRVDIRNSRFDAFVNRVSFENQETVGTMSVFVTNTSFFESRGIATDVYNPQVRARLSAYTGVQAKNADLSLVNVSIHLPSYKFLGDGALPSGSEYIGSHLNASGKSTVRLANTVLHTTGTPDLAPGEKLAPLAGFERCGSLPNCEAWVDETPVPGSPENLPFNYVDDLSVASLQGVFVGTLLYAGLPPQPGMILTKHASADGIARYEQPGECQSIEALPGGQGVCVMALAPRTYGETNPPVNGGNNALAVYPDGTRIVLDSVGRTRIVDTVVDMGAVETVITGKPDFYSTASGVTLQVPASSGVLANDLLCGTGPLVAETRPGLPSHGTLTFNSNGAFTYVPNPSFVGLDAFSYRIRIGTFDCLLGGYTTVVTIEVTAAPATPTATPSPTPTAAPPTPTPTPGPTATPVPPTPTPSTLIDDPFAMVNDRLQPDRDLWTVRGKVSLSPSDADQVVYDGLWGGLVVRIYQATGGAPSLLDTGVFSPFDCTTTTGGRNLYCKSGTSFVRLRRTRSAKDPNSFRISASVRNRDLAPNPYGLPLSFEIEVGSQVWVGLPSFSYCRVSHNGERTTCRLPRAG